MSNEFRTIRRVEFCDTDMAGIMHFSNFFRYMESAEVDFLRTQGLNVTMVWEGQSIGFPRVSAHCDYFKPAKFNESIEIAVRIEKIGSKSVTYAFEFTRGGDRLALGKVTSVCCRVNEDHRLESIEIPPGIRTLLESHKPQ